MNIYYLDEKVLDMSSISILSRNILAAICLIVLMVICPSTASATSTDVLEKQIEVLQKEVQRMMQELESIKNELKTDIETVAKDNQKTSATKTVKADDGYKVSTKGGIKIESNDGNFKAQLGGRILADFAWYDEDKSNLGEGTKFRATRLFLAGTLFKDWHFKGQYDFADDKAAAKDVYISYTGLEPFYFKVGHYKPPFSMEQLTSIRFITFLERGLTDNFVPGRLWGASVGTSGHHWSATAGVFGATSSGDVVDEGDENWSGIGRVTYAPINEKTRVLHLGLSGRYLIANDESVRFRAKPESNVTNVRFVDTGVMSDVDSTLSLNAELATVLGPFSLQSQYVHVSVDRQGINSDPDFQGAYVFASYFLTGESRNYHGKDGSFGRLTPHKNLNLIHGGLGAWEFITRYSWIDLTDDVISGGNERNYTVGLNWYPTPYVRFMMNYIWVDNDLAATGNLANLHAGQLFAGDDDPNVFQLRAQVDF